MENDFLTVFIEKQTAKLNEVLKNETMLQTQLELASRKNSQLIEYARQLEARVKEYEEVSTTQQTRIQELEKNVEELENDVNSLESQVEPPKAKKTIR